MTDSRSRRRRLAGALALLLAAALLPFLAVARPPLPAPAPDARVHWPDADHDPAIPTVQSVLGFEVGTELARHAEVRRYFDALAAAAPDRMRLVEIGRSWQGRSLFYAVISSPANLARLDEVRAGMAKLADPRRLAPGEGERLIASLPAPVWLGYSVHGNEPGTTDAALAVAHHLLASRGDPRVPRMLDQTVIVIVPLINPDGRERFIDSNRAGRGLEPDPSPLSAERDEPWPGGRMNHYVFDMNRDWFTKTQPEIRAVSAALLDWMPVVVADVHEMGTDQTYFFPPEAKPLNPNLTARQLANVEEIGRNNARWFDRFGLRYFTREIFDGFFPGYGSGWPNYQGASAMVYEQGSSRGLVARRSDGTILRYPETVQSQFVASLSAVEVVANARERYLRDFAQFRASAIEEGRREPVKAYVLSAEPDPDMAARLAVTLARNGIEVTRVPGEFQACGARFPAGGYVVSAAQPAKRLIRTLLDEKTTMDPEFVRRQQDRIARGLPDEIYDVTAWSLPLMYNVATRTCTAVPNVSGERVSADWQLPGGVVNPGATVAFLVPWGNTASARFLAAAVRAGIDVRSSNKPFTVDGVRYPSGSLVIPVAGARDLGARLQPLAVATGATVTGVDTGWVTDGPGFGSPNVLDIPTPRVALIWDEPTERYSAGHARFVLERQFGYPVTAIRGSRLATANLDGFDVLLIPGEGRTYRSAFGKGGVENLKNWVARGGVLIGLGTGTRFLADPEVDLLPIRLEDGVYEPKGDEGNGRGENGDGERAGKGGRDGGDSGGKSGGKDEASEGRVPGTILATEADLEKATLPEKQPPRPVAGVLARATVVDDEHWLAAGVQPTVNVLFSGNEIYAPARQNQADTVLRFAGPGEVLTSGVLWEDSRRQIAFKPFVVAKRERRGLVIGFTQDPNFRAQMNGLNLLLVNAVFRGAALVHDANAAGVAEEDDARR
ncbi:MAG: M14 family metallopeptidase [Steroidobacteraceae bacterium]|nr:M14 family metallopeptidase [Steroidobacteraceae bacterium]